MSITGLLIALLVGAVAGFLAGQIVKGHGFGLLGNIVVGVVGALLFGLLFGGFNLLQSPILNEIDSILGDGLEEFVSEIAFTLLPPDVYDTDGTSSVTVFYSDNTAELLSADLGNVAGGDDTFFYFVAPNGFASESLLFDGAQTGGGTCPEN